MSNSTVPIFTWSSITPSAIPFVVALTAFFDPHALLNPEPDNTPTDNRFTLQGKTAHNQLIAVRCRLDHDGSVRLLSAEKAAPLMVRNTKVTKDKIRQAKNHQSFATAIRNPYAELIAEGFTVIIEHDGHNERFVVKRFIDRL
jgi:uncharacterized DUF497 family protein